VDFGLDMNKNYDGDGTALMLAVRSGHLELVRELLDRGAEIHAKDADGKTALGWASRTNHQDVVRELFHRSPVFSMNAHFDCDSTALLEATRQGQTDAVFDLLSRCSGLDPRDSFGNTPLMVAVQNGYVELVRDYLVVYGVDVNAINYVGDTALKLAVNLGHVDIALILKEAGANE